MSSDTLPPIPSEVPISVMFDHCKRVYMKMMDESDYIDGGEVEGDMVVWTGRLTRLVEELNYSNPYYTKLKGHLTRMGCIQQLRRGGGSAPSVWLLKREPTEELFKAAEALHRPGSDPISHIQQMLLDMNSRIIALERTVTNLINFKADGSNN